MFISAENLKESIEKFVDIRLIYKSQSRSYILSMNKSNLKLKTIPFTLALKKLNI